MFIKSFILSFILSFGVGLPTSFFEGYVIPIMYDSHVRYKNTYDLSNILCKKSDKCSVLAEAAYFEARNQGDEGMLAVMKVVLNRTKHTKWPNTIKGVVYYKCQFSYTCDGSLKKAKYDREQWDRSYRLAYMLLSRYKDIDLKGSTHYHTTKIKPPYWAKEFKKIVVIQDHVFYNCNSKNC